MTACAFVVCVIILRDEKGSVRYLESYNDTRTNFTFTPYIARSMIIWDKETAMKLTEYLKQSNYWEEAEIYTRGVTAEVPGRRHAEFISFIEDPSADLIELTYKL